MNDSEPRIGHRLLHLSGRLFVSLVVTAVFASIAAGTMGVHGLLQESVQGRRTPGPLYVGIPPDLHHRQPPVSVPWPKFPGGSGRAAQACVLNGIAILSDEWETLAAPQVVLDYYREQMGFRGWDEFTEEEYGLQPEQRNGGPGGSALQDPQYLALYRRVVGSSLTLRRGTWSMNLRAEAHAQKPGMTAVQICAAETPSLKSFATALASGLAAGGGLGASSGALDAEQHLGSQRQRTRLYVSSQDPSVAFADALRDAQSRAWRPALGSPGGPHNAGHCAWLTKDGAQAVLSVQSSPDGRGSTVAFTEISTGH